jgi:hypothetical protein
MGGRYGGGGGDSTLHHLHGHPQQHHSQQQQQQYHLQELGGSAAGGKNHRSSGSLEGSESSENSVRSGDGRGGVGVGGQDSTPGQVRVGNKKPT